MTSIIFYSYNTYKTPYLFFILLMIWNISVVVLRICFSNLIICQFYRLSIIIDKTLCTNHWSGSNYTTSNFVDLFQSLFVSFIWESFVNYYINTVFDFIWYLFVDLPVSFGKGERITVNYALLKSTRSVLVFIYRSKELTIFRRQSFLFFIYLFSKIILSNTLCE